VEDNEVVRPLPSEEINPGLSKWVGSHRSGLIAVGWVVYKQNWSPISYLVMFSLSLSLSLSHTLSHSPFPYWK
jgi:hypothetical protein